MMFAQVEDLTGSVEATIFPRTYELTAPVWNTDEILLVLGRVEKRDEAPKILVEHAVRFDDQGMRDIKRVASETAERLARRSRFVRPGAMGAAPLGPAPAAGAPRRPTALTSTNGHGNGAGVSSTPGKHARVARPVASRVLVILRTWRATLRRRSFSPRATSSSRSGPLSSSRVRLACSAL